MAVVFKLKRTAFGLVLTLFLALPVTAQDVERGAAAIKRVDYATAHKELRPLAEKGHVGAQFLLAALYKYGRGVPQDHAEAVKLYRKIAEQGLSSSETQAPLGPKSLSYIVNVAKNWLGFMYSKGQGVPLDLVQAHMWHSLAAANGDEMAIEERDIIAKKLNAAQVAKSKKLAREWLAKQKKK
jgi:TPR repeat protein